MGIQQQPTILKFHKIGEKLLPVLPTTHGENTLAKGLLPYCFKLPTLEQSLGLLNGLCKFEDPLSRLQNTLKDWLLKLWVPPKPTVHSPKDWSVTLCLQVTKVLLNAQFSQPQCSQNVAFHHFFWHWEQQQCKPQPWLKALWPADVAWQPCLHKASLPCNESTLAVLSRFFTANTLNSQWLAQAVAGVFPVDVALWGALWEQYTLPWYSLLTQMETTCQQACLLLKFPYLNRLMKAYQAYHPTIMTTSPTSVKHHRTVQKILLVEGQSERCLLPTLGNALGINFEENGIWIIASGGKSATLQKCLGLLSWVNIPIAVLLDADAQTEAQQLLHLADTLHPLNQGEAHPLTVWVLEAGELEDTYPLAWVYAVLEQLPVGQEKEDTASLFIAHGLPARTPSFKVFEAFVLEAKAKGERASEAFRRFWLAWGYPPFDKRELAEGIAKNVPVLQGGAPDDDATRSTSLLLGWLKPILVGTKG